MNKICILGSGAMGLALSNVLTDNGYDVIVYGRNINQVNEINFKKTNTKYIDEIILNKNIVATNSIEEALSNSDILIIAVPTKAVIEIVNEVNKYLNHKVLVINASKGIEQNSFKRMQEIIQEYFNNEYLIGIVSLLGPGFAKEILKKNLTCICAVSKNIELAKQVQNIFSNDYFRVYTSIDVIGAEFASSIKNAIAIASGILKGLGYGENTKAALITRGFYELKTICKFFGALDETVTGLTGIGDLLLTCNSEESRNFSIGYKIGKEDSAEKVLKDNKITCEGLQTVYALHEIGKEKNIDLPIINGIYSIIYLNERPTKVAKELMNRPLKYEFYR